LSKVGQQIEAFAQLRAEVETEPLAQQQLKEVEAMIAHSLNHIQEDTADRDTTDRDTTATQ
jgi:hypothetical protein